MNTIKRIAFENVYESSIIFQSFAYANIPAEVLCAHFLLHFNLYVTIIVCEICTFSENLHFLCFLKILTRFL